MKQPTSVLQHIFELPPYSADSRLRNNLIREELQSLTNWHRERCDPYRRILDALWGIETSDIEQIPYLPVGIFKSHALKSIPDSSIVRVMTSSGTTGQAVSQIFLDRETAELQTRALSAILKTVLGSERQPMLIIDSETIIKNRNRFSARTAGVLGMYPFGRHHLFALDDQMQLRIEEVKSFLKRFDDRPITIFGFTFMVWKYLHLWLAERGLTLDFRSASLIHSGGWKALTELEVGNETFKAGLLETCGLKKIHNYYGMVEQTGSIFLEGDDGYLYPSNFSDVIIRDPVSLEPVPDGQSGLIQVLSVLPRSYPGHSLLTEDLGVIDGEGRQGAWQGKRLRVLGRLPRSEIRGCSDTHASKSSGFSNLQN